MHISLLCSIDKGFNLLLQDKIIAYGSNCNIDLVQTIKDSAYSLDQCWKTLYFFNFLQECEQDSGLKNSRPLNFWRIWAEFQREKQITTEFFKNVNKILLNRNSRRIPLSSAFFQNPVGKATFCRVSAAFLTGLLTEIPSRILAELMTSAFPSRILTGKVKVCYFSTFMLWILTIKADGIRILLDRNTSE